MGHSGIDRAIRKTAAHTATERTLSARWAFPARRSKPIIATMAPAAMPIAEAATL